MQTFSTRQIVAAALLMCCFALVLGAPTFAPGRIETVRQPPVADWWRLYTKIETQKQPPATVTVYRARLVDLSQQLQPFQERLTRLEHLKQWVLSNKETNEALTEHQRGTLAAPFFAWDRQSLQTEMVGRHEMATRLEQEASFVAQVEAVLHDVATHLPDLSPRWL